MTTRRIAVVTGSRAEYGLLRWLMQEIEDDRDLCLQTIATGMHLSPEYGLTYKEIERDGFVISDKVEMLLSSDSQVAIAKSVGLGVIGMAETFRRLQPDVVVVLGDRFEIMAAAQASALCLIPVAHISGGEITEGAIDDFIRHTITKLSHYHFVATEEYRERVICMGEEPDRVVNCGDPGLDGIARLPLLDRDELGKQIGFDVSGPYLLVSWHPATLGAVTPEHATAELFAALDRFAGFKIVMSKPNADPGGRVIARMMEDYAQAAPQRVFLSTSLGQVRYLSAMKHAGAVVGNSSSGIVEAPGFPRPAVNIGPRQLGRLRAASIIDCPENADAIEAAIRRAVSPEFESVLARTVSLYGNCNASHQIKEFLKKVDLPHPPVKRFYDVAGKRTSQ
jgi:UDP-N-acetyl-D-glucosamine 2-epimerase, UDP-hydrolysing